MNRSRYFVVAGAVLTLVALVRIVQSYRLTAQGFDEPCHVSAAIELLTHRTYTLDPYNPPLARIAIGLPLVLAGERYPKLVADDPNWKNYNYIGNLVLNDGGHYTRNLSLSRLGVLPFFILAAFVVFLWTRREFGDFAAVISVALFTTLPVILAFSGVAYSDMAPAFAQTAALLAFVNWLDEPSTKSCLWMGLTAGLALLAKFTSLLYLPAAVSFIVVCWWFLRNRNRAAPSLTRARVLRHITTAALLGTVVVWAGYGFSVGRVQESMQLSPQAMPSFQHFPGPVRPLARRLVLANPPLPAPGLLSGIAASYAFNKQAPPSYFRGQIKNGGWWYFFIVDLALKSPPAFLLLSFIGFIALAVDQRQDWRPLTPALAALAILLVTTTLKVNYGIRHVIVLFPLLAIVAGYGASRLWQLEGRRRVWGRVLLVTLLAGQLFSTIAARYDYLAYYNVLAGRDPSRLFVMGCDLDCGQDLIRLSRSLHARHISQLSLAMWTSADTDKADLPSFTVPLAYQPVTGWFAISLRSLRAGDVFHQGYPIDAFAWLDRYQPVERIGKTILLYYIPPDAAAAAPETGSRAGEKP